MNSESKNKENSKPSGEAWKLTLLGISPIPSGPCEAVRKALDRGGLDKCHV